MIFGEYNPAGRLVQTWYYGNYTQEIMMDNMNMRVNVSQNATVGRGYRYYYGDVVYPFGYGLSYTTFKCSGFSVNKNEFSVNIENTGKYDGSAVVMIYFEPTNGGKNNIETRRLVGFGRVDKLKKGGTSNLKMTMYQEFYESKEHANLDGKYVVSGACSS